VTRTINPVKTLLRCLMPALALVVSQAVYPHGDELEYSEQVEIMYVAYYGRPGDPAGVDFWASRVEAAGGSLAAVIDQFGNSPEYLERYGELDPATRVNNIFQQLLGRDADPAGRNYYVGQLQSGALSLASIALDIYNGVQGTDVGLVANKTGIAHMYTDAIADLGAEYGSEQIQQAKTIIDAVDDSQSSVDTARALLVELFDLPDLLSCDKFEGSFERIQEVVFDGYGCTDSACHGGSNPAGNLDLRAGVAYANLIRVKSSANMAEPMDLVFPGEQAFSFLFQKLAAGTNGSTLPTGGGESMPVGFAPLTEDHLEAMRLWIRAGAPEFRDVDGAAELLGCEAGTKPTTNKIAPPPPPQESKGVRFVSGPWTVPANSEGEVCFATYFDFEQTGQVPTWAKTDCAGGALNAYSGECFASNRNMLTQDPQSHHSIISVYTGASLPSDPAWGEWVCLNGPNAGTTCDPTRIGESVEQGGADCGGPLTACGTVPRPSIACTGFGPRDYRTRSSGAGGSQSPINVNNLADGVFDVMPTRGMVVWNSHAFNLSEEDTTVEQYLDYWFAPASDREFRNRGIFDTKDIFVARVPPFEQRTYCSHYTLPRGARLTNLSSHAHKRGILWQTWLPPQDPNCVVNSQPACQPNSTPPDYVSKIYNDPLYLDYNPPLEYDGATASSRTLKFCLTYDNGDQYPDLLKRSSVSVGSTCPNNAYCIGGSNEGELCGNDDAVCGGGGVCDACEVRGGFTTEDEMFLMLGSYYLVPVN
jgi:hypothetical protein